MTLWEIHHGSMPSYKYIHTYIRNWENVYIYKHISMSTYKFIPIYIYDLMRNPPCIRIHALIEVYPHIHQEFRDCLYIYISISLCVHISLSQHTYDIMIKLHALIEVYPHIHQELGNCLNIYKPISMSTYKFILTYIWHYKKSIMYKCPCPHRSLSPHTSGIGRLPICI